MLLVIALSTPCPLPQSLSSPSSPSSPSPWDNSLTGEIHISHGWLQAQRNTEKVNYFCLTLKCCYLCYSKRALSVLRKRLKQQNQGKRRRRRKPRALSSYLEKKTDTWRCYLLYWTTLSTSLGLFVYSSLLLAVCSDEGLTLETSAKHHIPQATNIPYQPC